MRDNASHPLGSCYHSCEIRYTPDPRDLDNHCVLGKIQLQFIVLAVGKEGKLVLKPRHAQAVRNSRHCSSLHPVHGTSDVEVASLGQSGLFFVEGIGGHRRGDLGSWLIGTDHPGIERNVRGVAVRLE